MAAMWAARWRPGCVSIPSGALYLARTRVSDCVVDGGNLAFGGGILASTVMAKYSEVSNNTVIGKDQVRGGGINSKYQTIMVGSTITGNSVQMRSPEPQVERSMGGGGIVSKYQTVLALSTISGNSVQAESGNIGGGGVLSGEVVSYYSTFSGNSAVTLAGNSVGGAIRAVQDGNTGPVQRLLDRLPEFPELAPGRPGALQLAGSTGTVTACARAGSVVQLPGRGMGAAACPGRLPSCWPTAW